MMNKELKKYIEKNNFYKCEKNTNSKIVFKDKKSATLTIKNPNNQKIFKIKVDDCLICGNETKKCDWIAANAENEKVTLIELKSRSLDDIIIVGQFLDTVDKIKLKKENCYCILVSLRNGFKSQKIPKKMKQNNLKFKHYIKSTTITTKELFPK